MTGGLVSLVLITAFVVGFWSMISSTVNRTTIMSEFRTYRHPEPPFIPLVGGKDNFMIAFMIKTLNSGYTFDLNKNPQFFDLTLAMITVTKGIYAPPVRL